MARSGTPRGAPGGGAMPDRDRGDVSPLCQMPLHPHGRLGVFGGADDSWPTFTSLLPLHLNAKRSADFPLTPLTSTI